MHENPETGHNLNPIAAEMAQICYKSHRVFVIFKYTCLHNEYKAKPESIAVNVSYGSVK
jgi:hypothetical protein